jgi:tRNA-dihydrouridine synthase
MFRYCTQNTTIPLCYNGNLYAKSDIAAFSAAYPEIEAVMLGRALIADPGMLIPGGTTVERLESFCDELLEAYTREFGGPRNAMFRLKENWRMMICLFDGNDKLRKRLLKTTDIGEFHAITHQILHTLPLRGSLKPDW